MIDRDGYELIVGSSVDPQFGPVLLFGLGGELVEVFRDRALGLPPLTATLARRMMERTRSTGAAGRARPGQVDIAALEQLLVRFRELVVEQPAIAELDINPLLASPERLLALDARVILHPADVPAADLPRPAIRPYPTQYVAHWQPPDGDDAAHPAHPARGRVAHRRLPPDALERDVYQRYFRTWASSSASPTSGSCGSASPTTTARWRSSPSATTPSRASSSSPASGASSGCAAPPRRELSLVVADDHQGMGLGTEMVHRLIEVARAERIDLLTADVLATNGGMLRIFGELGFEISDLEEAGETLRAELRLAE